MPAEVLIPLLLRELAAELLDFKENRAFLRVSWGPVANRTRDPLELVEPGCRKVLLRSVRIFILPRPEYFRAFARKSRVSGPSETALTLLRLRKAPQYKRFEIDNQGKLC